MFWHTKNQKWKNVLPLTCVILIFCGGKMKIFQTFLSWFYPCFWSFNDFCTTTLDEKFKLNVKCNIFVFEWLIFKIKWNWFEKKQDGKSALKTQCLMWWTDRLTNTQILFQCEYIKNFHQISTICHYVLHCYVPTYIAFIYAKLFCIWSNEFGWASKKCKFAAQFVSNL